MSAKVLQLPAADALWHEANDLTAELNDLFGDCASFPCPEVVQDIAYEWTRESCSDVRRALGLLRAALEILEETSDREIERFQAHCERLESLGIEP